MCHGIELTPIIYLRLLIKHWTGFVAEVHGTDFFRGISQHTVGIIAYSYEK